MTSPAKRREAAQKICKTVKASERRVSRVIGINRRVIRYEVKRRADEEALTHRITELACRYGRYGYRRITALLRTEGFIVNHKRVERIWREQGLKVPRKQPKKGRLWLNDGSCVRLRPEYPNHVWSYDFIEDKLSGGKKLRWLNIIDESSRVCLYSEPRRRWTHMDVHEVLSQLFITRGVPDYIRSDNGSEFTAKALRAFLHRVGVQTSYIEPGSPWENGYCESFNSRMRDEFLNMERFDTLYEAQVLTKRWVWEYNTIRPHSSLHYRPPAPQTLLTA